MVLCSGHQNNYHKTTLSYGNFKGRSEIWCRKFIRQCHVMSFIQKELKSIIKKSGHYAIQGVLHVLPKAHEELAKDNPVVLLNEGSSSAAISKPSMADYNTMQQSSGCDSKGKGTHGLIVVRQLLADKGESLKTNLTGSFLEHPAEEKINAYYI